MTAVPPPMLATARLLALCLVWALSLPAPAAPLQVVPDKDSDLAQGFAAYERGEHARALQLFRQAAERNQRVAQFNLAVMLLGGQGGQPD